MSHSIDTSVEKWFRGSRTVLFITIDSIDHLGDWSYETRRRLMKRLAERSYPHKTGPGQFVARVQDAGKMAHKEWQQSRSSRQSVTHRQDALDYQMAQEYADCVSDCPEESATIFDGLTGELMPRCAKCYRRVKRRFPEIFILQEREQLEEKSGAKSRRAFKGDACAEDNGSLDCTRLSVESSGGF